MATIDERIKGLGASPAAPKLGNPLRIPTAPMTADAVGERDEEAELARLAMAEPELRTWAEEQKAAIEKKFEGKEKEVERKQLVQTLSQAVVQLGAAMQGARTGVDLSALKPIQTDFGKELDRAERRRERGIAGVERETGARRGLRERLEERRQRRAELAARREEAEKGRQFAREERIAGQEFRAGEAAKQRASQAALAGQAQAARAAAAKILAEGKEKHKDLSKGEKKVDETFAKEYASFVAAGGSSTAKKNITDLKEAIEVLKTSDEVSGPIIGLMPKIVRDIVVPEGASAQERIELVIQQSLRRILGAQFTEKEGQRLMERTFNPRLSEEENLRRAQSLLNQLEQAAEAKQAAVDYYEENKTLSGFKGKVFTLADFNPEVKPKSAPKSAPTPKAAPAPRQKGEKLHEMITPDGDSIFVPSKDIPEAEAAGARLK